MNAQTTYLHHSSPPIEGTTSDRGRLAEQLQFSHKPYYSSVRTTAAEGTDISFRTFRRRKFITCGQFKRV